MQGALLLLGGARSYALPAVIYSQPGFESPVRGDPGDLLLLAGDGFAATDTVVYQALADTTQTLTTPTNVAGSNSASAGVAPVVSVLNVPRSLTVRLPEAMAADQSYALWVRNSAGEWSNGVKINDARPMWFTPDFSYTTASLASLPRQLKVVGRNLLPPAGATTQVRLVGPATYILPAANDGDPSTAIERYAAIVTLPTPMAVGTYAVQVSRDGVSWVDVADGKGFTILADPTTPASFSVSDPAYGGCAADDGLDDTPCIIAAIAAARASGGGNVVFGRGVWEMAHDSVPGVVYFGVLVPVGVSLIGSGSDYTVIQRDTSWDMGRPIFTLQGQNTVQGIRFKDAYTYQPTDPGRQLLALGVAPANAQSYNPTDPSSVSQVIITQNVFDKPFVAVQDGGMPIDHLYVTYNTFGAYDTGLLIGGTSHLTDSVIDYNSFLPGSYIDVAAAQGAIPTGISSADRVDFSDNLADGTATQYLYNPATDPKGFRAAYFWTLVGNQERELVARNTATCSGDKAGDGEAFSFDDNYNLGALPALQPVLTASANSITVAGPLVTQSDGTAYPPGYFNNFWITVGQGPGEGQARRITSYSGAGPITFNVSPAWDVLPQTTSQITVAKQLWQVYVVDNYVDQSMPLCQKSNANRPAGGVIELYGQSSDSAIEGNRQYDANGIAVSLGYTVSDSTYGTYPDTKYQNFLEIRGNTINGEYAYSSSCSFGGIQVEYASTPTSGYPPPVMGYGISVSHNTVSQADGFHDGAITFSRPWFAGPPPDAGGWEAVESALVFDNSITNIQPPLPGSTTPWTSCTAGQAQRLGIHVDDGMVWHTAFAGNACTNVANGTTGTGYFLDRGTRSQRVCSGATSNSCECSSYVQGTSSTQSGSLSSLAGSYPQVQTAGDLNIVVVDWGGAPAAVTVTDSVGNTYGRQGSVLNAAASATGSITRYQAVFFAKNIVGSSANTVTAAFSSAVTGATLRLLEYRGIDINSPVDTNTGASGTGTVADSGWMSTNNNNELLLGIVTTPASTIATDPDYTVTGMDIANSAMLEQRFVSAPGAYHATASVSPSNWWIMHLFALNLAGQGSVNTQALTAPSGLTATASSSTAVNLSWTASTDNLGVAAYLVERCTGSGCKSFVQIATASGTSYTDTNPPVSTPCTYRVRATDRAGLLSPYSNTASATAAQ